MKKVNWVVVGFLLICFYILKNCNGCGDSDNMESSEYNITSGSDDSVPSWLEGTWVSTSQYGTIKVIINGNHIYENLGGSVYNSTFRIHDGAIYPNSDSHVYYPLDFSSRKIGDGMGGYLTKQ